MKKIDHNNIIKLYEIFDDDNSEKLYLVMPVADYGESVIWSKVDMQFMPNHKLLAKNNAKKFKMLPKDSKYYSEKYIREYAG